MICAARGHCDHATWTMNEEGVGITAEDIEDCPDFKVSTDHVSEVVAEEILKLNPEMYEKAQVQFSFPYKLLARIYLKKNILDDKEEVRELLEEVSEMLENLSVETLDIQDMIIRIDFTFESESNPKIPNSLPAGIGVANQLENRDPTGEDDTWEDEEDEDEDEGERRDEGNEWDDDEDPDHEGESPIDWGEE